MTRPPPHSYRPVSDLSRVVKIPVLRCTASQDIKAKPTRSLSDKGAFHQSVAALADASASPHYTALLAVFTV